MKTIIALILVLSIGGCGSEMAGFDRDVFFNEMYTECVDMCNLCPTWAEMCGYEWTQSTTDACVNYHWNIGTDNRSCSGNLSDSIQTLIDTQQCETESDTEWICERVL